MQGALSHDDLGGPAGDQPGSAPEIVSAAALCRQHPELKPPLIDGLLRIGEICNVIASPKVGKSWFVLMLAVSVALGLHWLGFPTQKGRVLIIDNELHSETLAGRLLTVLNALGVSPEDIGVDIVSLRGRLMDISRYQQIIDAAGDRYSLIIIDAKYRAQLTGSSENSNSDEARFYNLLDRYAAQAGSAIVVVHHASKGSQAGKDVTDIGAGAGAQSRAADAHLTIRPHREDGHCVLDAVVRSFRPVEAKTIKMEFPVWKLADDMQPALKQPETRGEARQASKDEAGKLEIIDSINRGNASKKQVRADTGMGHDRVNRLFRQLIEEGRLEVIGTDSAAGKTFDLYQSTGTEG